MQELRMLVLIVVIAVAAGVALIASPVWAADAEVAVSHHVGNDGHGGAVAIVVPIAFFTLVAALVFLPLFMRNRRRALDAQVQAKAIEAGMQYVPPLPAPPGGL